MFDDNFPTSEDGDFSYRAFKMGYKFDTLISTQQKTHRGKKKFREMTYKDPEGNTLKMKKYEVMEALKTIHLIMPFVAFFWFLLIFILQ